MTRPGSPTEPGLVERLIIDVLDTFHDGQREKKARAIAAALREAAALRSPLPDREGKEDGSSRDLSPSITGGREDAPSEPPPEGTLYPRGFMPYWTEAKDAEQAVYGLAYILQQIQATPTYKPVIGQTGAARSSLEFAIRALSGGAERVQLGAKHRDDLNSTSIPSSGDALKEALSDASLARYAQEVVENSARYAYAYTNEGALNVILSVLRAFRDRLALSPPQSSRGTGE